MKIKKTIFIIMMLGFTSVVFSQAFHWLSKPKSGLGLIMNAGGFSQTESTISANGRFIAFSSRATNLINKPLNSFVDVFVYDHITEEVQRVNETNDTSLTDLDITLYSAPSSDGKLIAFVSSSDFGMGAFDDALYLKNFATGDVTLLSVDENNDVFSVFGGFLILSDVGDFVDFATETKLAVGHDNLIYNVYRLDINTGEYVLISRSEDNSLAADAAIYTYAVSNNGRFSVFISEASNLVSNPVVGENVYIRDIFNQTTKLVTVQPSGQPSADTDQINDISVSNDGDVVFVTRKDDLVVGDTNGARDLFLSSDGVNQRINLNNGAQLTSTSPFQISINAQGNLITFSDRFHYTTDDTNGSLSTYQYDINADTFTFIDTIIDDPSHSSNIGISADGQFLLLFAFPDVVTPDSSLGAVFHDGLYVLDVSTNEIKQIEPVASSPDAALANVRRLYMSSDQRYAIFSSTSPNLLTQAQVDDTNDTYLHDRSTDETSVIAFNASAVDISANGRYVLFFTRYVPPLGAVNEGSSSLYLYDRIMETYLKVDAADTFAKVNDSGLVVFVTDEALLPNDDNGNDDIYIFNSANQRYSLISQNISGVVGGDESFNPDINDDGVNVSVVFTSRADNLIVGDSNDQPDVFVADWPSGLITRVSENAAGVGGNAISNLGDLTADGSEVVFTSLATNLTAENPNGGNVFLYERSAGRVGMVTKNPDGSPMNLSGLSTNISDGGGFITFTTSTSLDFLGEEIGNNDFDVFLINRITGVVSLVSQTLEGGGTDGAALQADVYEDLNVSPPLIGVSFTADGELTGLPNHPGYTEAFLYQEGGPNLNLNIGVTGTGSVGGSLGISCMTDCDFDFTLGTELSLLATATGGFIFDRWNSSRGQCVDDTNPCLLTMDQTKQIQAIFIDPADFIFADSFE